MAVIVPFREHVAFWRGQEFAIGIAMIVLGALARLALLVLPVHGFDSWIYRHWTWRLVHEPLNHFYNDDGQAFPDHLPGDMWLLKLLGEILDTFSPGIDFYGTGFIAAIALMAAAFDAVLTMVIWKAGTAIGKEREGAIAGVVYWCMPAPIFVGSGWGQTDGISAAIGVTALGLAITGRYSRAFVVLTICVLVKPQYALLALPLLAGWWQADRGVMTKWLRDVAFTATACMALTAAIIAPFGMSVVGEWGRWSLIERVKLSTDLYPVSALGAHNIWGALDPLRWPPDDRLPWLLGLGRQSVGLLLFAVIVAIVSWALVRRWQGTVTLILASNVLMFGFFLFTTRMHERYLFPVLGMSLLLAVLDARFWRYAAAVNALVFANIGLRYVWPLNNSWTGWRYVVGFGWLEHPVTVWFLVLATVLVFVYLVLQLFTRPVPARP